MSTKALTARLIVESAEARAALWRTHRVFNERLRLVHRHVHRMKRGDPDQRYKQLFGILMQGQARGTVTPMEAVTDPGWKPKTNKPNEWQRLAADLIADGKPLFDREKELPGLPSRFTRKLFEAAFQLIKGNKELTGLWKAEHKRWQEEGCEWKEKNPEYMRVRRELLDAFEKGHGTAGKRRGRWHKWLAFLRTHPELAAWKGGPAVIHAESAEAKQRLRSAPKGKRNKVEAEEFFKANPELHALDKLHGEYEAKFARTRAKRKHHDGFKHPPTFTEPGPVPEPEERRDQKHPFWYQFKKEESYWNLDIEAGTIDLQLLPHEGQAPKKGSKWPRLTVRLRPDPRLRHFSKAETPVKVGNKKYTLSFNDPAFSKWDPDSGKEIPFPRPAEIRGAKLIFRPAREDGAVYLYFTCDLLDLDGRLTVTQEWLDKKAKENKRKKWAADAIGPVRERIMRDVEGDAPLVTCAVDLGLRHLGAATVRKQDRIVRARILREADEPGRGPRLPAIRDHKAALKEARSKRGKPIAGQKSCIELQEHVDKMAEDRFKRGARRIVRFAYENHCDLIILENLAGFVPDAERERGANRRLLEWNRGNLVKWVKMLANDAGMRVVEVDARYTSQLCSHCDCGAMGARFSAVRDPVTKKGGQLKFERGGKMFACPQCGYMANADHNASVNLHKRFYGELPGVRQPDPWKQVYRVTRNAHEPVEVDMADVERKLRPRLEDACRGTAPPPTPF